MPIISAVGLSCCDKFKETPNEKVCNMSKLTKSYFKDRELGSYFKAHLFKSEMLICGLMQEQQNV